MSFDPRRAREDFPALARDEPLSYLDNAATTQLPAVVIDAVACFGRRGRANVRRSVHALGAEATAAYEAARATVQRFLNAPSAREIVFVRNATEGINLVAQTFGRARVGAGDDVVITEMEHHSNLVPWQQLCAERRAQLRRIPVTADGELDLAEIELVLGSRTRLLAITHVSNALGTVNDIRRISALAHERKIPLLVDGAQAAAHLALDVRALGVDFYVISAHKAYGPTGIGALYGRSDLLEDMPPFLSGGDMVESVSFEKTRFDEIPHKFEAGTPNLEGAVGFAAALDYLSALDRPAVAEHEARLTAEACTRLAAIPGVTIIGRPKTRSTIVSFVVDGIHPHDLGTVLDHEGVAIRAGHHCSQPLLARLGVTATARVSVGLYNTDDDIDALISAVRRAKAIFS